MNKYTETTRSDRVRTIIYISIFSGVEEKINRRRIPEGGLTYTSYRLRKVPYAITKIKGIKYTGTDGSYVTFSLGGNKYAVKSNGLARILIAHGDSFHETKWLYKDYNVFVFDGETWELGEGYVLTVKSVELISNPRKVSKPSQQQSISITLQHCAYLHTNSVAKAMKLERVSLMNQYLMTIAILGRTG